jgi:hypothetical protein
MHINLLYHWPTRSTLRYWQIFLKDGNPAFFHPPPSHTGWLIAISAAQHVWRRVKEAGFKYIHTRNLFQVILYRVGGTCRVYRLHYSIVHYILLPTPLVGITIIPLQSILTPRNRVRAVCCLPILEASYSSPDCFFRTFRIRWLSATYSVSYSHAELCRDPCPKVALVGPNRDHLISQFVALETTSLCRIRPVCLYIAWQWVYSRNS